MEEGGVHESSYITWLLHHLVAVLCNDANGEKGGGGLFLSQAGAKSAVSAEAHNARLCCFHMRGVLFGSRQNCGGSAPGQILARQL